MNKTKNTTIKSLILHLTLLRHKLSHLERVWAEGGGRLVAVIAALCILPAYSRAQQLLPLDSVLSAVQRANPALRQYDYRARAKAAAVAGATSWEAPRISAGYFMKPYSPPRSAEMASDRGMRMVGVEQMIPNPARQRARRAYLAGQAAVEQASQGALFNTLRSQARGLYFNQVILEKKQRVLDQSEQLLEFLLQIAQARYPYNQSSLADIYQVQSRVALLGNDHAELYGQLRQNRIALNTLMARDPAAEFVVDTLLPAPSAALLPADTAALAAARSDVRGLNEQLNVLRLSREVEANRRRPEFGIRYDHMNGIGPRPNQFTLMGMVTLPFAPWSAREYRANTAALGLEAQAVQQQRASLLLDATGRLRTLQSELQTRQQQVANFEANILPALHKTYQVTLLAYEQNTAQLPAVIEAIDAWLRLRLRYLDTQNELLTLRVQYDQELEQ